MTFGELIGMIIACAAPVAVFVALPAYLGWLLGRHLRGR